jgi:5-(carboxyamino)imidazole ribonucleotide synthase
MSGKPLSPGSTIGILGGGQLGRMLAQAAYNLGYKVHGYCPDEGKTPLSQVTGDYTRAAYEDEAALAAFASRVDVVTYEFENVPAGTVDHLVKSVPVRPNGEALAIIQDRLEEKSFLAAAGIPVAPFASIARQEDFAAAVLKTGIPAVLKTRRFGYDGKGQARIRSGAEVETAYAEIGRAPAILEGFVAFDREVSIIAARGLDGSTRIYPLTENRHVNHILDLSIAPADAAPTVAARADEMARTILEKLDYVGVLAIEFFLKGEDLLVNELAPRVHNSGHWTIEGAATSQFEQHIRAICGLPLGDSQALFRSEMTNLIGDAVHTWPAILQEPGAHLHLYGKAQARPGRKMGHVTRLKPLD